MLFSTVNNFDTGDSGTSCLSISVRATHLKVLKTTSTRIYLTLFGLGFFGVPGPEGGGGGGGHKSESIDAIDMKFGV